jgi:tetratricopeptide (TPR) repeat protein
MAGQLRRAIADCTESLRLKSDDVTTLHVRGVAYIKLDQLDDAVADFSAALEIDSGHAASLYGRGLAKKRKRELEEEPDIAAAKAIAPDIVSEEFARFALR